MTNEEVMQLMTDMGLHEGGIENWVMDNAWVLVVNKAIEKEREACAKLCDLAMLQNQEAINELEEDEHIAQCFIQGAMTQLVKTSKAIRARGQA